MSAADLNLVTVELSSTLLTAPLSGAPSSSDYNESQRNTLVDLATLADFINNQLLPLINALPAGALQPTNFPVGIEGRTIWSDTSDQSALFFNTLASTPLTLADSLRLLSGTLTTMNQQLIDLGVEVATLQAQLSSTNQNDIALALQNLSASLNQLTLNQDIQNTQITQIINDKAVTVRSSSTNVPAGLTVTVSLAFATAFNDDFYTVTTSVEVLDGPAPLVSVGGFHKNSVGLGLTASVSNFDTVSHNVIVHAVALHD